MKIINRTPHPITIVPFGTTSEDTVITIPAAPRGEIARVQTTSAVEPPLYVDFARETVAAIPRVRMSWGRVIGLPDPLPGVCHVVSAIVVAAAHAHGRDLDDLYVPGDQVRDESGRIVGCSALAVAATALPGETLTWRPHAAMRHMVNVAALLAYRDDPLPAEQEQSFASRRRGRWPEQAHFVVRLPEAYGGSYVSVHQAWGTDSWVIAAIGGEETAAQYLVSA